ncbi:MAG: O-antigen ligase family protein [Bdellovibrionales bacterium]|nr:O-antigen ligase family protein [Bdellovibrionales bacterium]
MTSHTSVLNRESFLSSKRIEKLTLGLAFGVALCVPVKLSLTYAFLLPLILLWSYENFDNRAFVFQQVRAWALPFLAFVLMSMVTGLFGLHPLGSAFHLFRLGFNFLVAIVFFRLAEERYFLLLTAALLFGQFIGSLHTVLESAFPGHIPVIFHGAVSESGQLAITSIFAFGLFLQTLERSESRAARAALVQVMTTSLAVGIFASSHWLRLPLWLQFFALGALLVHLSSNMFRVVSLYNNLERPRAMLVFLASLVLPLLFAALIVNLKRGPWAGVTAGMLILLFCHARRFLVPFLGVVCLLAVFLEPVASRIVQMPAHFFMSGGRGTIWDIGLELALRFPLGIGFDNSGVLRQFSPEVPSVLNHFHSNFLNILVETGWPGFALYLWWLVSIVVFALFRHRVSPLTTSVLAVIVSWQVAGLAEYNFGDSEVLLTLLVVLGISLRGLQPSSAQAKFSTMAASHD